MFSTERARGESKCKGPGAGTGLAPLRYKKPFWLQMEGIEAKGEDGVRETGKIKSCRALKEGHGKEYRFYSHVMEAIIGF